MNTSFISTSDKITGIVAGMWLKGRLFTSQVPDSSHHKHWWDSSSRAKVLKQFSSLRQTKTTTKHGGQ